MDSSCCKIEVFFELLTYVINCHAALLWFILGVSSYLSVKKHFSLFLDVFDSNCDVTFSENSFG